MITNDPVKLMVLIRDKEQLVQRLRVLVARAMKEESPDIFVLNKELQKQKLLGKNLIQIYNSNLSKLADERKAMMGLAKRQEETILRELRDQVVSYNLQPRTEE